MKKRKINIPIYDFSKRISDLIVNAVSDDTEKKLNQDIPVVFINGLDDEPLKFTHQEYRHNSEYNSNHLQELTSFFNNIQCNNFKIPVKDGIILDVNKFIQTHLSVCTRNLGNMYYDSFFDRLYELKKLFTLKKS